MALTKSHNRMIEDAPINVKDYGAVGDGITDDRAAFIAAFAAAPVGGTVVIPDSTSYYVFNNDNGLTDAVAITHALTVVLDGTVKATYGTNQANPPYIFNVTGNDFTLTGQGTLQGDGTYIVDNTITANVPGLVYLQGDNVVIDGVTFKDPSQAAIKMDDITNVKILNCEFTGGPIAADATAPQHYYILSAGGGYLHIVSGNKFYATAGGCARNAITYGSTSIAKGLTITNNQFTDIHEHCTYLTAVENSVISNNTISYNQASADQKGVALKAGGDHNTITGNTIYGAALGGITAYDASDTVISNNTLYNYGSIGITVTDNVSSTAFNTNIIDSNVLYADTALNLFEGIQYKGDAATTNDCVGGKITNNIISNAGTTAAARAAISVYHANTGKLMIDFDVSGNAIRYPKNIGIYAVALTRSKISQNTIYDPQTANSRAIYISDCTYLRVEGNVARDHQTTTLMDKFINIAGSGNNYIDLINNSCFATTTTPSLGKSGAYNSFGRGNRIDEENSLRGSFTLNNVSSLVINNANIDEPTETTHYTAINITPLNANAATIMGSSKALYVDDTTLKTSFRVATADGTTTAASDAIFAYEIIQ